MPRRALDFVDLVSSGQALQMILFACPDGVVVTNADDEVILYAGACEQLFGFAPIEVMHRPFARLFDDRAGFRSFRCDLLREGRLMSRDLTARKADGGEFSAAVSAAPVHERDGSLLGTVFYIRDYSRMREIEQVLTHRNRELRTLVSELDEAARYDPLTGVFNRAAAMQAAERLLLTAPPGEPFAVVILDIDQFKGVNDTYGHLVGDKVLSATARGIRESARADDVVGRFGGEEFIVFLPGADAASAYHFAERARRAVESTTVLADELRLSVTISAGLAAIPSSAATLHDAIESADLRLLEAKRAGRNRTCGLPEGNERSAA